MNRVVNLDWLEVYCLEPFLPGYIPALDRSAFSEAGFIVIPREYGTPTYEEMFYISFPNMPNVPFIEVRRRPRGASTSGSFLPPNACHLRLTNRFCYHPFAYEGLVSFLAKFGYDFQNIKRVDICLDFNRFDTGELPAQFVTNFLQNKYLKINQANIALHGVDGWNGRYFNSIKWGSPKSNISTKLYNKTLELKQSTSKQYIQDLWREAGLDLSKDIWRVEFSIKAGAKGFKNIKTQQFYKMQLSTISSREKLLFLFHMLANQYFHFKYNEEKRKDRCRDKLLFVSNEAERAFKPSTFKTTPDLTRSDKILMNKLYKYTEDPYKPEEIKGYSRIIADYLYDTIFRYFGI